MEGRQIGGRAQATHLGLAVGSPRDAAGLNPTGISRQTGSKGGQRFLKGGLAGLADRLHTRPRRAGRGPAEMECRL